jgi:hypothetical protein
MAKRERLIPLINKSVVEDPGWPLAECNRCVSEGIETKSVVAMEFQGEHVHRFYGLCLKHAKDFSWFWQERK